MNGRTILWIALVATAWSPSIVDAQTSWNRELRDISILPGPSGGHLLYARWEAGVESGSTPQDLGLEVVFSVNGTAVGATPQTCVATFALPCVDVTGGCLDGPCGDWIGPDGATYEGRCRQNPFTGQCRCTVTFFTVSPELTLSTGDTIEVSLVPFATALPEFDTFDDTQTRVFDGLVPAPTRAIHDLEIVPSPTGGEELLITWAVEAGGESSAGESLDLSTIVEVYADGALIFSTLHAVETEGPIAVCEPCPPGQCAIFHCGNPPVEFPGNCIESPQGVCVCGKLMVDPIPLPPQFDLLEVTLVPVPGALPELPGFPEDEGEIVREQFIRGDCNHDGLYNLADSVALLDELFGQADPVPCDDACDANDDGGKNIGDVIYILNSLFGMGPLPPQPHPDCGPDPTDDDLGCDLYLCLE